MSDENKIFEELYHRMFSFQNDALSHINIIVGYAELLTKGECSPINKEQMACVEPILKMAIDMADLIRDFVKETLELIPDE